MKDEATKERLLKEQHTITEKFEWATCHMLEGKEGSEQERKALAEELAANYWALDPYVRARSLYDRLGILKSSGPVDFYVKSANALG